MEVFLEQQAPVVDDQERKDGRALRLDPARCGFEPADLARIAPVRRDPAALRGRRSRPERLDAEVGRGDRGPDDEHSQDETHAAVLYPQDQVCGPGSISKSPVS